MSKLKWIAGGALVVVVLLGGVGAFFAARLSPDVALDEAAPEVSFQGLDGQPIALKEHRGQVVLLDFWAST